VHRRDSTQAASFPPPHGDLSVLGELVAVQAGYDLWTPRILSYAVQVNAATNLRFGHPVPPARLRPKPIMVRFRDCCSVSMPRP
jgi:hypothetical protein